MARPKRFDHCLCGRVRHLATNNPIDGVNPPLFYTTFDVANVPGSGAVCRGAIGLTGLTLLRQVRIKVVGQSSRSANPLCPNSFGNLDINHNWVLVTVEYDDTKGIWYGETSTMPLEPGYGYTMCWEMWLHGNSNALAMQFYIKDGEDIITPVFGISALAGLGNFAKSSVLYLTTDGNCTLSGEYVDYRDVLPKFLFTLPPGYTVTFDSDFSTVAGTFGGSYVTQPQCYQTQICPEGSDPDYTLGGTFSCRQLEEHQCGVNWSAAWVYQADECCFYKGAGDLAWISCGLTNAQIYFGANTFVSSIQARYSNLGYSGDVYWGTPGNPSCTLAFDPLFSTNGWWTASPTPGPWTAPATITVTALEFD